MDKYTIQRYLSKVSQCGVYECREDATGQLSAVTEFDEQPTLELHDRTIAVEYELHRVRKVFYFFYFLQSPLYNRVVQEWVLNTENR